MKIKLFLLEYTLYLLIGLSCLLDLEWLDSILIFLFYLILANCKMKSSTQ